MKEVHSKPPGRSVAASAAAKSADGLPRDIGTLRELWRFREYARPERRPLLLGVLMRGLELAADLATPWPLALVIDDLLKGDKKKGGVLHDVAGWFGGSAVAMLTI